MSSTNAQDEAPERADNPLIVIASNRGPYQFSRDEEGHFTSTRGAGGLVTALGQLAAQHEVLWIASALSEDDRAWAEAQAGAIRNMEGINLRLVIPDGEAYRQYYNVIANPLLWFIHHQLWDTPRQPAIDKAIWQAWEEGYVAINRQFADVIVDSVRQQLAENPDETRPVIIMPQDYHLYMVPHFVRDQLGYEVQIQPFLHTPWPGPDVWRILPKSMRETMLRSLLHANRIGFQTKRDSFNFVQTCRFYVDNAHSHGSRNSIEYEGHKVSATAYPISIDVEKVTELVKGMEAQMHRERLIGLLGGRKLILRIDRIEPSKNILRGLHAYRTLLEEYPEHRGDVQMMALLVPSRMEVEEYQTYLSEIMAEAGLINATYSDGFWEPVRIIVGNNYHRALAAMQLYNVLLVNPVADGMNLVAKEGVLVNEHNGVLLLSEHAGAYYELGEHALTVSPFDVYSTAHAMNEALTMPHDERQKRAQKLHDIVSKSGVTTWFQDQIDDALSDVSKNAKKSSAPETPSTSKSEA